MTATEQTLTQLDWTREDFTIGHEMAQKLGYSQTAYTSGSALIGLYCLADNASHRPGCIIKTAELGFMFVQTREDVG